MKIEFRMDAPIWKFFGFLWEILVTNVLFILTSLPILTMGASVTAMNAVFFKRSERKLDSVPGEYFKAFKENFVQSTIIWVFYLAFLTMCFLNINVNSAYMLAGRKTILICFGLILAVLTIVVLFALAMTARFDNNLVDTIFKSAIIGILNVPYAIAIVLMITAALIVTFSSSITLLISIAVWATLGFGIIGYLSCLMFLRAFRRFTAKEYLEADSQTEEMYRAREADRERHLYRKNRKPGKLHS